MRVYVIGTSGSGKSTLSAQIAQRLSINHLELDSLRHQANWTPMPETEMLSRVTEFSESDNWVIDGNYSFVRDTVLSRVTEVVMLDYRRSLVMWRIIRRTLSRMIGRKVLWNGNREDWRFLFKLDPEENVILWAWQTFEKRRRDFDEIIQGLSPDIKVHRFRHPSQTQNWLATLG